MKKGILIAIGVAAVIVIAAMIGLNDNIGKETKIIPNPNVNSTTSPPPTQPIIAHGKNFSVNLGENLGISAH